MTEHSAPPVATPTPGQVDEPWAAWHLRVAATLVDVALGLPFIVVGSILSTLATDPASNAVIQLICLLLGLANAIGSLVFGIWNQIVRQGRRGASLGKQCFGLLVISKNDARPIGALLTFARSLAHILDMLPLLLGYFWPIWDRQKQTFADKVVNTAVLRLPGVRF